MVQRSVLLPRAAAGARATLYGAILCRDAAVRRGAVLNRSVSIEPKKPFPLPEYGLIPVLAAHSAQRWCSLILPLKFVLKWKTASCFPQL